MFQMFPERVQVEAPGPDSLLEYVGPTPHSSCYHEARQCHLLGIRQGCASY